MHKGIQKASHPQSHVRVPERSSAACTKAFRRKGVCLTPKTAPKHKADCVPDHSGNERKGAPQNTPPRSPTHTKGQTPRTQGPARGSACR